MAEIKILEGYVEYLEAIKLLEYKHNLICNNLNADCFFILEHQPVYTLGKRGGIDNIVNIKSIQNCFIPIIESNRGGNITYHGPGQVVIYPVISLKKLGIGIKEYIRRLEEIVILTTKKFGLESARSDINRGVWIDNKKISSVGVSVKKGVTLHGIALNVNIDMKPFSWINPCGLVDIKATSLESEIDKIISIDLVKNEICKTIKTIFRELDFEY